MPHLAVVIVSWNVRDMLRRCLRAVDASFAGSACACEVVVVDNASSDGTPAMLRAEFPHVRLREAGRNLGFAAANNLALTDYLQESDNPASYILLLNPDTEPVGDALPRLVRYLEDHPDVVVVGPQLRYPDGSVQSSRRRFPTRMTFFWESTPLERLWRSNPWARRYHCAEVSHQTEQRVDWLVGAALLVRRDAIQQAGLLDPTFFLYSEELEWQRRLQQTRAPAHSAIVYLPSAVVIHAEGKSSEQVPAARHIHFQQSKLLLARQWYGAQFAAILRSFLIMCYVWDVAVEGGKYLVGHRRSLRRERMVVYVRVLHHLLVSGLSH